MQRNEAAKLMRRAIALGRPHHPHPNPRVGALVVSPQGRVAGVGAHEGPGRPHAETLALAGAGGAAREGTLVVTLEPCHHHGLTAPCTEAILAAGVRRVWVGSEDPDPRVSGRGLAALRRAGLEVEAGIERGAAEALDPGYFHHRRTGRPRVTLKAALTLDGQVAAADRSSRWISGAEARADAHLLRGRSDAVMIGAGTLLADDPRLTVRRPGHTGPDPLPVVVAGTRPLPHDRRLFARKTVVLSPSPADLPAEVLVVPGADGRVDLGGGLEELGRLGVLDLLVEGGPTLASALWREGLVDRGVFYYAGKLAGGTGLPVLSGAFPSLERAGRVRLVDARPVGEDLRVEFVTEDG